MMTSNLLRCFAEYGHRAFPEHATTIEEGSGCSVHRTGRLHRTKRNTGPHRRFRRDHRTWRGRTSETVREEKQDDYSAILLKALADQLAEAFAEKLHETVRKEIWGYAAGEVFDNDALIKEAYDGIRPAPGLSACPDHTEKPELFRLLDAQKHTGITLTEGLAMYPTAAVSGLYSPIRSPNI